MRAYASHALAGAPDIVTCQPDTRAGWMVRCCPPSALGTTFRAALFAFAEGHGPRTLLACSGSRAYGSALADLIYGED
ncbi:hypothetical protein GCM10023079_18520 [Streptomyces chitinivorans]